MSHDVDIIATDGLVLSSGEKTALIDEYTAYPERFTVKYTVQLFDPISSSWQYMGSSVCIPTCATKAEAEKAIRGMKKAIKVEGALFRIKEMRLKKERT